MSGDHVYACCSSKRELSKTPDKSQNSATQPVQERISPEKKRQKAGRNLSEIMVSDDSVIDLLDSDSDPEAELVSRSSQHQQLLSLR